MKLQEYELKRLGQQAVDMYDDIRELANYGKFAHPIVASPPTWTADNGEMVFFTTLGAGTDRRIYVRLDSSWIVFAQFLGVGSGPSSSATPGGSEGSVQYNSGGVFAGEKNFLWSSTGRSLLINASGGSPIIQVLSTGSWNLLTMTSAGDLSLGRYGNAKAGSVSGDGGVVSLGVTGHPSSVSDATQIYGHDNDGSTTTAGLWVRSEAGGPHYLGEQMICSGGTLIVRDNGGATAATVQIEGYTDFSAMVRFGTTVDTDKARLEYVGNATLPWNAPVPPATHQYLRTRLITVTTPGYLLFSRPANTIAQGRNIESPAFIFAGDTMTVAANQQLVNQRFFYIESSYISGSATGPLASISNAATVFIEGPPLVAGNTGTTVFNAYALWIKRGPVRIDGAIISGQAGTQGTVPSLFLTTTAFHVASNNASPITLIRAIAGTTSLAANTLSEGRTIRLQAMGYYNTPPVPDTLTVTVVLGGTTVLSTGAQTPTASASTLGWSLNALITCQTTGGAGTVFGQGFFEAGSTIAGTISDWHMVTSSTTVINTTGANVLELRAQWGGAQATEQLYLTNCLGELLN